MRRREVATATHRVVHPRKSRDQPELIRSELRVGQRWKGRCLNHMGGAEGPGYRPGPPSALWGEQPSASRRRGVHPRGPIQGRNSVRSLCAPLRSEHRDHLSTTRNFAVAINLFTAYLSQFALI